MDGFYNLVCFIKLQPAIFPVSTFHSHELPADTTQRFLQ